MIRERLDLIERANSDRHDNLKSEILQKIKKNKEEVNQHTGVVEQQILQTLKDLDKKMDINDQKYNEQFALIQANQDERFALLQSNQDERFTHLQSNQEEQSTKLVELAG